jgi:hypothetical protein
MPEPRTDLGEETQRFQAFQDRTDENPPPWRMRAGGRKITVLAVIVVVVAIVALIFGKILVG